MKNITTDDFRFGTFCWSLALVFVLAMVFTTVTLFGHFDHEFDVKCIDSGKSLVYETLQGSDYAKKVCK